jgi:hypothetical protein
VEAVARLTAHTRVALRTVTAVVRQAPATAVVLPTVATSVAKGGEIAGVEVDLIRAAAAAVAVDHTLVKARAELTVRGGAVVVPSRLLPCPRRFEWKRHLRRPEEWMSLVACVPPNRNKHDHLVPDPVLLLRAATALDRDLDLLRLIEAKNVVTVDHPQGRDLGRTRGAARHYQDNRTRDEADLRPIHVVRLGRAQLLVARTPDHQVVIRPADNTKDDFKK